MIRRAEGKDSRIAVDLAILLWPNHNVNDLENEIEEYIALNKGVIFIYFDGSSPIGFAQCNLRNDYVEGTDGSPVGYLEGIFVKDEFRGRGIAKELVTQCENWAKDQGCKEFASDCELHNNDSLEFHLKLGFQEANRIICFKKNIG